MIRQLMVAIDPGLIILKRFAPGADPNATSKIDESDLIPTSFLFSRYSKIHVFVASAVAKTPAQPDEDLEKQCRVQTQTGLEPVHAYKRECVILRLSPVASHALSRQRHRNKS